jgi:hypothetical protein
VKYLSSNTTNKLAITPQRASADRAEQPSSRYHSVMVLLRLLASMLALQCCLLAA